MAPLVSFPWQFDMMGGPQTPISTLTPTQNAQDGQTNSTVMPVAVGSILGIIVLTVLIGVASYHHKKHRKAKMDAINEANRQYRLQHARGTIDGWLSQVGHELSDLPSCGGRTGPEIIPNVASAAPRPSFDRNFQFPAATLASSSTQEETTITRPQLKRESLFNSNATTSSSTQVDTITETDITDIRVHNLSAGVATGFVSTPVFGLSIQQGNSPFGNGHATRNAGPVPQFPLVTRAELDEDITNTKPTKLWSPVAPGTTSDVVLRERNIIGYEEIGYTLREKNRSDALAILEGRSIPRSAL